MILFVFRGASSAVSINQPGQAHICATAPDPFAPPKNKKEYPLVSGSAINKPPPTGFGPSGGSQEPKVVPPKKANNRENSYRTPYRLFTCSCVSRGFPSSLARASNPSR